MLSPALRYARPSYMPKFAPDSSCVLWLPGQDDAQSSTIRDRSGKGNDGTITNATWVRNSKGLWVNRFDGDDDIDCGNTVSLQPTSFSYGCWFKPSAITHNHILVSKKSGNDGWYIDTVSDKPRLLLSNGTGAADVIWADTAYVVGQWVKVRFTYNATTDVAVVYINGVSDQGGGTGSYADFAPDTAVSLLIGKYTTVYAKGDIALEEMDNRAISAAEELGRFNQERHLFGV